MKIRSEPALLQEAGDEIIILVFPERNGLLPAVSVIYSPGAFSRYHSRAGRPLLFFPVWLFEKQSNIPVRRISGSTFVEKELINSGRRDIPKSETITFRLPWRGGGYHKQKEQL